MVSWLPGAVLLCMILPLTVTGQDQACTDIDAMDYMWMIQCYGINSTNVHQVTAILNDIKLKHPRVRIRVEVSDSVGAALPDDVFDGYKIESVVMKNCGFTTIPFGLVTSLPPHLVNLDLSQNQIGAIDFERLNALPYAHNLVHLRLYSNKIESLPEDAFVNFGNLTILDLQDNLLEELVDNTFRGLGHLRGLYLFDNQISRVGSEAFSVMEKLQLLALEMNKIEFLEDGTLSAQNHTSLNEVPLEGNPFHCNCTLQWLKDYLQSINYLERSGATCVYPRIASFSAVDFCASEVVPEPNQNSKFRTIKDRLFKSSAYNSHQLT